MKEQGIVTRVEGDLVWVSGQDCLSCAEGGHCAACGPSSVSIVTNSGSAGHAAGASVGHHEEINLFGVKREHSFAVRNSLQLGLRPGDRVEFYVAPGKAIKAGFFVLMLPVLMFFLLYLLSGALWKGAGETVRIATGVGGVALGFLVNLALKGRLREYPEITRKV